MLLCSFWEETLTFFVFWEDAEEAPPWFLLGLPPAPAEEPEATALWGCWEAALARSCIWLFSSSCSLRASSSLEMKESVYIRQRKSPRFTRKENLLLLLFCNGLLNILQLLSKLLTGKKGSIFHAIYDLINLKKFLLCKTGSITQSCLLVSFPIFIGLLLSTQSLGKLQTAKLWKIKGRDKQDLLNIFPYSCSNCWSGERLVGLDACLDGLLSLGDALGGAVINSLSTNWPSPSIEFKVSHTTEDSLRKPWSVTNKNSSWKYFTCAYAKFTRTH